MRAAWYERFGPAADVLETGEADTPSAGPGEVLVRVAFSGVNPSDSKARAGSRPHARLGQGRAFPTVRAGASP